MANTSSIKAAMIKDNAFVQVCVCVCVCVCACVCVCVSRQRLRAVVGGCWWGSFTGVFSIQQGSFAGSVRCYRALVLFVASFDLTRAAAFQLVAAACQSAPPAARRQAGALISSP